MPGWQKQRARWNKYANTRYENRFFLKSRLTKDNKTEMIMNMKSSGK